MAVQLPIPTQKIAEFCRRNAIRKLALFGSVLRDDFRPDSDVDVLVEFDRNAKVNYFMFVDMQDSLHQLLQREIDLHTLQSLSPHIRCDIMQSAEVIYEQEGGEAASTVTEETRQLYPHLEWRKMIGMRNRIAHEYGNIDYSIVWNTVEDILPILINDLEQIIASDEKQA